ncbi:MAG: bidirectional hydrogenase complex protein HoxE [Candidatus Aquicultorales bacterium]
MNLKQPVPPSDDKRWKIVDKTMRQHGYESHSLIQVLHTVQETFGFIGEEAMGYVASSLRVPLSQVYGVATFYHFFTLKPQGEHTCVICTGTACYIKGAESLLKEVEETIGARPGETTPDNKVSVLEARCIGSCGLAPIAVLDGETASKITPEGLKDQVQAWTDATGDSKGVPTSPAEGPAPQNPTIKGVTAA